MGRKSITRCGVRSSTSSSNQFADNISPLGCGPGSKGSARRASLDSMEERPYRTGGSVRALVERIEMQGGSVRLGQPMDLNSIQHGAVRPTRLSGRLRLTMASFRPSDATRVEDHPWTTR